MVFNRKCKRILSSLLALSTLATFAATTVSADELTVAYDSTATGATPTGYQDVTVELEKAEVYSVTLPKSVVLDGTAESTSLDYAVTATGEISSVHYVRVIPLAGSKLYNEDGTVSLDLDVTLNKRRWDDTEILAASGSNATAGVMSVDSIEPGKWTGKIRFLVTLDDGGDWTPATCTSPAICTGYDDNDDGVISEDEKLGTPITKGKSLGHSFAEGSSAFPDTCQRCKKMVYAISTAEQLTAFRDAVNAGTTFAGATVELDGDIDMSETPWDTGIGVNPSKYFQGIFEGNGHTIKNLNVTRTATATKAYEYDYCVGLFNYLYNKDVILRNFILDSCSFELKHADGAGNSGTDSEGIGAVVGLYDTYSTDVTLTIDNVHVQNTNYKGTETTVNTHVGGLVGSVDDAHATVNIVNSSVVGCSAYASMTTTTGMDAIICTGAAIGYARGMCNIQNSVFSMSAAVGDTGYYSLGYVVSNQSVSGAAADLHKITNCVVDTTVCADLHDFHYSLYSQAPVYTNCLQSTTDECQSQTAVDILNTDNTKTWVLDLENLNNGYPLIK